MFERNSALVVALYLVAGVGIAVFAYLAYLTQATATHELVRGVPTVESRSREVRTTNAQGAVHVAALARANEQLAQAQQEVKHVQLQLHRRNLEVEKQRQQLERLRQQLAESMALNVSLADATEDEPADAAEESEASDDLAQLRRALTLAQTVERQQQQEMTELRAKLLESEVELANLQRESTQSTTALLERYQAVEASSAQVLTEMGIISVPLLVDYLSDRRASVRLWAVGVLGQIGPDARDALPSIRRLRNDPDVTVRRQATAAIATIDL